MRHKVDLDEISDGKIYHLQDMAKLGCQDCKGCSSCCQGMGNSITLDPYDYYRLSLGLKKSFIELLENEMELQVYDGVIIPSLKMKACTDSCYYLNEEGRCSIHSIRPSVCRLFPLGRYYHDEDFDYILQDKECQKSNRTKIKISKWIDTPNQIENRKFILVWYQLLKRIENQSN